MLDTQLGREQYVAGEYSIADLSIWPWASRHEWQEISLHDFPNVKRWYVELAGREAVQTAANEVLATLKKGGGKANVPQAGTSVTCLVRNAAPPVVVPATGGV